MESEARAQVLLEGGSETAEALIEAIVRRIDEMAAGGVLEVTSWVPGIELDIKGWCEHAGHELLQVLADGASTRFWIGKGGAEQETYSGLKQDGRVRTEGR